MGLLLVVLLVIVLVGATPRWNYLRNWGYGPSGLLGLILVVFLFMLLFNVVHWETMRFNY